MSLPPEVLITNGTLFNFYEPEKSEFTIEDIAHSLSNLCRFTGHVKDFYSVAQHSYMVSMLVPAHLALDGLLHDAAEAFMGDVSTPLKQLLPHYKAIERAVEREVLGRFGVTPGEHPEVKHADIQMFATERRCLTNHPDKDKAFHGIEPLDWGIVALQPAAAKAFFLKRFHDLTGGKYQ